MSPGVSSSRKELGALGEQLTADYLIEKGYNILCRNFQCKLGEIDLIAEVDEYLVFVEVKTRASQKIDPLISITHKKQKKILNLARYYLAYKFDGEPKQPRFDVVAVSFDQKHSRIEHIENAFTFR